MTSSSERADLDRLLAEARAAEAVVLDLQDQVRLARERASQAMRRYNQEADRLQLRLFEEGP